MITTMTAPFQIWNCNIFEYCLDTNWVITIYFLELEDKDKKSQDLLKLLEVKNMENQKYKTAADIAKVTMSKGR